MANTSFKGFLSMAVKLDPHTNALKKKWGKYKGFNNLTSRTNQKILELQNKQGEGEGGEGGAGAGRVNKLAGMRFRRRRYAKTDSHYLDIGKRGTSRRVGVGKSGTVYLPPEIPEEEMERERRRRRRMEELEKELKDAEAKLDKATEGAGSGVEKLIGRSDLDDLKFMSELEKVTKEPPAAVMFQKIYRGWRTREAIRRKLVEEQDRKKAGEKIALKLQSRFRGNKARSQVGEMRKAVDRDAERELTEMEEEAVDEPFSIPGEPTATYTTLLNNKFKDNGGQPLLRVKRIRDNGDCLFETLVYFIRRVGAKGLHLTITGSAREIVDEILELVGRYGEDNEEGLNLQIQIMRDYLANSVIKDWTESQPKLGGNFYMTLLDESAGGGGIFKGRDDYLTHMTSKNEDDAKSKLTEKGYGYKRQGRFGGVPELLEFQKLFNTKVQIIKGQKQNGTGPTELRFDGHPPGLFEVKENDIFDTKVMTLIYYSHSTNAKPPMAEPAPHYELIELTDAGEALAKSREEDLSLLEELDETEEGKRSSAAPAISSGKRNISDCVQFTYPDGGVVSGIINRDRLGGIKIQGLYVSSDGKTMWGMTPTFDPKDKRLKDWAPTGEEFRTFFQTYEQHFAEKKENIATKYEKLNASIDRMPKIKEIMIERVKKLKKILEIEKERPSETTRGRLVTAKRSLNLTNQKLKTEIDKMRREGGIKTTFDSILKLFGQRDTVRNDWKKLNSAKKNAEKIIPMLERCIKRKGGKRKRKTKRKRKRRKRKKKKSTRRKR